MPKREEPSAAADTRSAVENSNELVGPQKEAHRSTYATSAPPKPRPAPHGGGNHPLPPDPPRGQSHCQAEEAAVAATAAELEEALQEVARRGARIEALTCEVAWYRHWADTYWQQLQSLSAAAASNQHHHQQQLAAMANYQNAANQSFAAAAQNFANAAAAVKDGPHGVEAASAAAAAPNFNGAAGFPEQQAANNVQRAANFGNSVPMDTNAGDREGGGGGSNMHGGPAGAGFSGAPGFNPPGQGFSGAGFSQQVGASGNRMESSAARPVTPGNDAAAAPRQGDYYSGRQQQGPMSTV